MKSIVVFGDIRFHFIQGIDHLPALTKVQGGAMLMAEAIARALRNDSVVEQPAIYVPDELNYVEDPESDEIGVYRWKAANKIAGTQGKKRYCLVSNRPTGSVFAPLPKSDLRLALKDGAFGGIKNASVPDVVVLDDLNLHLRKHRFSLTDKKGKIDLSDDEINRLNGIIEDSEDRIDQAQESIMVLDERLGSALPEQIEGIETQIGDTRDGARNASVDGSSATIELMMKRLVHSARKVDGSGVKCPVEPVVLLSVADDVPSLEFTLDSEDLNVWQHIHRCDSLCRRTVVIFDAATLRRDISISSGLSWERTAQDTILEFKRSKKLRPYLKFGHIVIRYGLTGLLLISNDGNSDWTNTLFFNPDQDDCEFTHSEDGVVLGASSVLVATIVEQLNARCAWRKGRAILSDLRNCLDQALLLATNRLLNHFELGYRTGKNFSATAGSVDREVFQPRSDVLRSRDERSKNDCRTRLAVQRVKLAPLRSRHWSILAQSCQADINDVAENIVKHGSKIALNTLEKPEEDFIRAWVEQILNGKRVKEIETVINDDTKSTLKEVLTKGEASIRRLVGTSLYESAVQLEQGATTDSLKKLGSRANKRIGKFRARLDELAKRLAVAGESDLEGKVAQLRDTMSDVKVSEVRRTYLIIRMEIRQSDCWGSVEEIISKIDSKKYFDFSYWLERALVSKLKALEPIQGWSSPISTPVLRLGKPPKHNDTTDERLVIVDRAGVESIRAVKRMIEQYLRIDEDDETDESKNDSKRRDGPHHDRPLSIAVFGPPGAGKSLAVKMIVKMMEGKGKETHQMTINLSQLPGIKELDEKLGEVVKVSAEQKLPIVFFDEFDSSLNDKSHGWLRYFLSPMEDGELIKSAVFVFAGGTCDTFEAFSLADRSRSDPQWAEFSEKKGPDFVSRLKGHINVVGINPTSPDDDLFVIRRAIALRFLLSQKQGLQENDQAKLDQNMLNAFLHVPHYVHGTRSMRMLIDLCVNREGNVVSMSEMPPIHQLDMQVDGKAFAALASGQTRPVTRPHTSASEMHEV